MSRESRAPIHGSRRAALGWLALGPWILLSACNERRVVRNPEPALVLVTVSLTEADSALLQRSVVLAVGQGTKLPARSSGEQSIAIGLRIEHYSALQRAFTVRVLYAKGGQILFSPVLIVHPDERKQVDIEVDETVQVLTVGVSLAE